MKPNIALIIITSLFLRHTTVIGGLLGLAFNDEPNQYANSGKWNIGPGAVTTRIVMGGLIGGTTGNLIGASIRQTFTIQGKKESYNTMRKKMILH